MLVKWDLYFVVLHPRLMIMIQVSDSGPKDPLLIVFTTVDLFRLNSIVSVLCNFE